MPSDYATRNRLQGARLRRRTRSFGGEAREEAVDRGRGEHTTRRQHELEEPLLGFRPLGGAGEEHRGPRQRDGDDVERRGEPESRPARDALRAEDHDRQHAEQQDSVQLGGSEESEERAEQRLHASLLAVIIGASRVRLEAASYVTPKERLRGDRRRAAVRGRRRLW